MTDYATCIVAADVERSVDNTSLYSIGAVGKAYKSRCVVMAGCNGALHNEVLNGGAVDVAKEGCT